MARMPSLFVSHGGPNVVTDPSQARTFLQGLSARLEQPEAIVVFSAHFEAPGPAVVRDPQPEMIYDFSGFAPELFQMTYPAPGDTVLADTVAELLAAAGYQPTKLQKRGFDHGVWNPLILAYPKADIPVVQVSVDPTRDAAWHHGVGAALAPLRDEGVLLMGSGHITHNLREVIGIMRGRPGTPEFPDKVSAFTDWFFQTLSTNDTARLLDWTNEAPYAQANHPEPEHLLPIFVAYGAGRGTAKAERIHASTQMNGAFAWDAYLFS